MCCHLPVTLDKPRLIIKILSVFSVEENTPEPLFNTRKMTQFAGSTPDQKGLAGLIVLAHCYHRDRLSCFCASLISAGNTIRDSCTRPTQCSTRSRSSAEFPALPAAIGVEETNTFDETTVTCITTVGYDDLVERTLLRRHELKRIVTITSSLN